MAAEGVAMRRLFAAGGLLAGLGLVGYAAGVVVPYEGRAFSVTAFMLGVTMLAIGSGGGSEAIA